MHKLDEVFRLTYGGFLQPFQVALRQKRIQMNPIPRYQASRRLAVMVYEEALRLATQSWSKELKSIKIDGEDVKIESASACGASMVIVGLVESLNEYLDGLISSTDVVVSFMGQFIREMRSFVLYEQSLKAGDSVACELVLLCWQETMALAGKSKYVELISRWAEVGYFEMSAATLQLQRLNRFLLLSRGKGRLGMDDGCEMLNLWTKVMGGSNELDAVITKTLFLPLMRRCGKSVDALFGGGVAPPKSSTSPMEKLERKCIFALLVKSQALTPLGRIVLREGQFWDHVAASAIEAVDEGKGGQTQKEKTLASLFANVATSDAVDAPEDGWGSIRDEHPTQVDGDDSDEDESRSDDEWVGRMSKYKFSKNIQGHISDWRVAGKEVPKERNKNV